MLPRFGCCVTKFIQLVEFLARIRRQLLRSADKLVFFPEEIPIIEGLLLLLGGTANPRGTGSGIKITRELSCLIGGTDAR
jgi:hypothetical protein